MTMSFYQPALVSICAVGDELEPITDESRGPVKTDSEPKFIEKVLASGKKKRFLQQVTNRYTISWEHMPFDSSQAIDGGNGVSYLFPLATSGQPVTFALTFKLEDGTLIQNGVDCFVTDFSYEPSIRRGPFENWRFNVSLSLEEIGQ